MNNNQLEKEAKALFESSLYEDAAEVYYLMADGDPSLDAGYLGHKIGLCYERLGRKCAAAYWFGRAVDENPTVQQYIEARARVYGRLS